VIVGPGAIMELGPLLQERHGQRRAVIISDATVAAAIPAPLANTPVFTFPAGERHKNRDSWARLSDRLLDEKFGRDSLVVAIGGGVTTDLAGFVAATYLRGIPWIAVPTTTLAMVDAAIGGKTGVDTAHGKNLIGALHHPDAVVIDPLLLSTLPERTFREGLAEVVKHAAILDAAHGTWLHANADAIGARDADTLAALIRRSVELKASVVSVDEQEEGQRAILNAGHTVAHALEQVTDFGIPHGEAVAIGLVLETRCAERMQVCRRGTADTIAALLRALDLPTELPEGIDASALATAMQSDKKNRAGVVRAALLAKFGEIARNGEEWTMPLELKLMTGDG
jgi:3-dehydroquinate synthase